MGYVYAGTLGGQNAYDCRDCGVVVRESWRNEHDALHAKMDEEARDTPLFRLLPAVAATG